MSRVGEPFDEIMIVNPFNNKGEKRMRFNQIEESELAGYFGEAPEPFGFFAETPEGVGYIRESPEAMGYYGEPVEAIGFGYCEGCPMVRGCGELPADVGYFADPPPGFFSGMDQPELAYYAEAPGEMGYSGEASDYVSEWPEVGYFAETPDLAEMAPEMGYFAESPEMQGYGEMPADVGFFAEAPQAMEGYMRETMPAFSPRVLPLDTVGGVEGYVSPKTINPTCQSFKPAEEVVQPTTQWFRPLW